MTKLIIEQVPVGSLKPYDRNARIHSPKQIAQIAASITAFGFNNPVLIDKNGGIIAGHGRVEAAKLLGLDTVPCVRLEHLSESQKRAYILADNKLAENAGWDPEILKIELQHLTSLDLDFDVSVSLVDALALPQHAQLHHRPVKPGLIDTFGTLCRSEIGTRLLPQRTHWWC